LKILAPSTATRDKGVSRGGFKRYQEGVSRGGIKRVYVDSFAKGRLRLK